MNFKETVDHIMNKKGYYAIPNSFYVYVNAKDLTRYAIYFDNDAYTYEKIWVEDGSIKTECYSELELTKFIDCLEHI